MIVAWVTSIMNKVEDKMTLVVFDDDLIDYSHYYKNNVEKDMITLHVM